VQAPATGRQRCSVTIITRNEERNLRDCLASAAWADEIVLVDSGSTDRTLEIARAAGARVEHQDFLGYGKQKQRAVELAKHDWVLVVDDDEVLDDEGGALAVVDGDELLGDMSWHKQQTNALTESFCWNFGIVLRPEARGKGHGSRAQRLLADYLFLHTTVNRVEASTDIDNIAEQRSLEKAGFTREGVLRGWQWRQGAWRDMVLYSRLRGDE